MRQDLINSFKDLDIPDWVRRIKIDVGTSVNAPFSEFWTNEDKDCYVIAFEPNVYNIESIHNESGKMWPIWLKKEKIDQSVKIFNCALSNSEGEVEFFCTLEDGGTSSLYRPRIAAIKEVTKVTKIKFDTFFEYFDWVRFPVIEHLKIDAQSSDYEILLGISPGYLKRIAYIDIETHTNGQYDHDEDPSLIKGYLESHGFSCFSHGINSSFINPSLKDHNIKYLTLQE